MESLKIPKTKYTLDVDFNAENGVLEMAGSSYPENATDFFQPLFDWLEEYISEVKNNVSLNLKVDYLNTSSTKCIMNILEILETYSNGGGHVKVNWYYPEDDEDILDTGNEISEDKELPIDFIYYVVD